MNFRKCILLVILDIFLFSSDRSIADDRTTIIYESIDDSWIRSQTLVTNHVFANPSRPDARIQSTTPQNLYSNESKVNAVLGFKLIDIQYASMKPSEKFKQFSKIRADALSLNFFSQTKMSNRTGLLPEVCSYFEQWPALSVENWMNQLSPNQTSQYSEYIEKYATEPPPLELRWVIFATWLIKGNEWNDNSKVPEPMLSRFVYMAKAYRKLNEVRKISVIDIAKAESDDIDPLCQLMPANPYYPNNQYPRICMAVCTSYSFEYAHQIHNLCQEKEVSFRMADNRSELESNNERMTVCYCNYTHSNTEPNELYISRAYISNQILIYRLDHSIGKLFLENLNINVSIIDEMNSFDFVEQ